MQPYEWRDVLDDLLPAGCVWEEDNPAPPPDDVLLCLVVRGPRAVRFVGNRIRHRDAFCLLLRGADPVACVAWEDVAAVSVLSNRGQAWRTTLQAIVAAIRAAEPASQTSAPDALCAGLEALSGDSPEVRRGRRLLADTLTELFLQENCPDVEPEMRREVEGSLRKLFGVTSSGRDPVALFPRHGKGDQVRESLQSWRHQVWTLSDRREAVAWIQRRMSQLLELLIDRGRRAGPALDPDEVNPKDDEDEELW